MLVEIFPVVDGCLIGAVSLLSGIVWAAASATIAVADRLLLANKLGTIEQQTCFDALTGLRNQRMFEAKGFDAAPRHRAVRADLRRPRRAEGGERRAGHPAGDQLIRRAVKAIRSVVRRRADLDGLFRRGDAADEFWWIVERSRIHIAVQLAEQVLTALRSVSITASIGVVRVGRTIDPNLRADRACRRATDAKGQA